MSIKTILVHQANDPDHMSRLLVAWHLARRLGAHVTALYVTTPVGMPVAIEGRGASVGFLREAIEIAEEKAKKVEAEFRQWCQEHNVTFDWTTAKGDHLTLLARRSMFADLAIVSQSDPANLEEMLFDHLPDRLPFAASCPTLVVPHGYEGRHVGRKILVGWKASRECSRAVRDSLPLLKAADEVAMVAIQERQEDPLLKEAEAWLNRQGITLKTALVPHKGGSTGEILLAQAAKHGSDMIVMGGYGHSRLRELVLGGATHEMLTSAPVPVLMTH